MLYIYIYFLERGDQNLISIKEAVGYSETGFCKRGTHVDTVLGEIVVVLNTSSRKIFRTKSTDVVKDCMLMFNRQKAKDAIFNGKRKFLTNYASLNNLVCSVFQNCTNAEIAAISVKS